MTFVSTTLPLGSILLAGLFVSLSLAVACDGAESCPSHPCDPTSDGDPFDVLHWCAEEGECACKSADASAPPCSLELIDASETVTLPIGELWSTLGGRHDLVITYASCDQDSQPLHIDDVQIRLDGEPALCTSTNPCDPTGTPTVTTCPGIPSTVKSIALSFTYDGAEGQASLQVEMRDTTCSYFCS
jgi:hypothetical protein